MAAADSSLATGTVVRKLAFTAVGVLLFAASLTVVFLAMRSVMDVGGYCASGGPYEIRQECPGGTWLLPVGIFTGLIGVGFVVAGTFRGGPTLWTLAWPALFLALGWNFLRYGIDPPPPEEGLVWGWLICAVAFILMGGIPLLLLLANARTAFWGTDDGPPGSRRKDAPKPSKPAKAPKAQPAARSTPPVPFGTTTVAASAASAATAPATTPTQAPSPLTSPARTRVAEPSGTDLVSDLERLATLHRDGALNDDEYARAKTARLDEERS